MRNMNPNDFSSSLGSFVCLSLGALFFASNLASASESSHRTYPHCANPPSHGGGGIVIISGGGHEESYPDAQPHGESSYPDAQPHDDPSYPAEHDDYSEDSDDYSNTDNSDYGSLYPLSSGSQYRRAYSADDPVVIFDPSAGDLKDGKTYLLIAKHSKKCLDVADHSTYSGGRLHQWTCHGNDNQKFKAHKLKKGGWTLEGVESYLCLKAGKNGLCDGDGLVLGKDCKGDRPKLDIKPSKKSPYAYNLKFQYSKKCLDVEASSYSDGAKVQQWACHEGENQDWYLHPAE